MRQAVTRYANIGDDRIEYSGGFVQFVPPPADQQDKYTQQLRKRQAKIRAELPRVHGKADGPDRFRVPTPADTIASVYGRADPDFQVRPCACYRGHFDPIGRYFDEDPD